MMKKIYKIFIVFIYASIIFLGQACTENFDDLNHDPGLLNEDRVDIDLLLTRLEYRCFISSAYDGNDNYGEMCGMCDREDNSPFNNNDAPAIWTASYKNNINNATEIIRIIDGKSDKDDLVNKKAIARIIRVWAVALLTDTYGDVPYSESCLPKDQVIFQPKYDTQQSIYNDLFNELKEAVAQFDDTKESFGNADLIYGGDIAQWEKFANSLRLRLALRVCYVDQALAQSQMSDLTESGLITTVDDDAFVNYSDDDQAYFNPRYEILYRGGGADYDQVWTGKVMIDILMNDSVNLDPRLPLYADTVMAAFKGGVSPNGYTVPDYLYRGRPITAMNDVSYLHPWASGTCSKFSDFWRVKITMSPIIRSSEVYFNLAEARLQGLLPSGFTGSANDYYQKGIDQSLEWYQAFYELGAPQIPDVMLNYVHPEWTDDDVDEYLEYKRMKADDITAFKATPIYTLAGSTDEQLEMIINQKIVALYPQEFQGWCEYRRTGYPCVPILPDVDALKGEIPRRESWPIEEETLNGDNYQEALARYGGSDDRNISFWWDANQDAPHIYEWTPPTMPTSY